MCGTCIFFLFLLFLFCSCSSEFELEHLGDILSVSMLYGFVFCTILIVLWDVVVYMLLQAIALQVKFQPRAPFCCLLYFFHHCCCCCCYCWWCFVWLECFFSSPLFLTKTIIIIHVFNPHKERERVEQFWMRWCMWCAGCLWHTTSSRAKAIIIKRSAVYSLILFHSSTLSSCFLSSSFLLSSCSEDAAFSYFAWNVRKATTATAHEKRHNRKKMCE